MMRAVLALALLASVGYAHGGMFRPPPRQGPRDPVRGPVAPGTFTRGAGQAAPVSPWEAWWHLHRERYLRVRERMVRREVITGPGQRNDLFDRRALREHVLIPEVLKALRDPDEEVRTSAAVAAGKFGARDAIETLHEMRRKDRSKQVREAALLGLLLMRDPQLREPLREIVLDGNEDRRQRGFAVLALGFLGDSGFLQKVLLGREVKLIGSGTAVDDLRACAALALGHAGDPSVAGALLKTSQSRTAPKSAVGYAAGSLGRLGNPIVLPEVLDLVLDRDARDEARYGAAIAAGSLVRSGEQALVDTLARQAQRDKNGGVRALLIMSLGRIGGERAATHLAGGMSRCDQQLRGFHYLALGISGSEESGLLLLEEFERLKDNSDRSACALGLGLLGHKPAAERLRKEVERGNLGFVPHGMVALGLLDDSDSIPLVQDILEKSRDPVVRREGAVALALLRRSAAIPDLLRLLERSRALYTRGAIATALGLVGTDKAVEPLLEIYRDKTRQGEERAIALAALGRIGDPEPIPLLARIAFDLNPYVVVDAIGEVLTIL